MKYMADFQSNYYTYAKVPFDRYIKGIKNYQLYTHKNILIKKIFCIKMIIDNYQKFKLKKLQQKIL